MVERERIVKLNNCEVMEEGEFVAYWVQSSPRIEYNHTFEYAKFLCEKYKKPIFIFFILNSDFPDAKPRAFEFLIEGISDFKNALKEINLALTIFKGDKESVLVIPETISEKALAIVTDKGYLKYQRELNKEVASKVRCPFFEVESNVVVPIEIASDHEEYGAYTIRNKINRQIGKFISDPKDEFLNENFKIKSHKYLYGKNIKKDNGRNSEIHGIEDKSYYNNETGCDKLPQEKSYEKEINHIDKCNLVREIELGNLIFDVDNEHEIEIFLSSIEDDNYYPLEIRGGEEEAKKILAKFIAEKLDNYHLYSNNPFIDVHSGLSPYLHFGQISPIYIYKKVAESGRNQEAVDGFLEELVVRRELAFNFCYFNREYYDFKKILHDWCYETLEKHREDRREYLYTLEELENFRTHDRYWNDAQKDLVTKGTMDNYMRMYWAKKIIEWSIDAETAFNNTLYLNNRYFLDGRDPNSFAGVAWCYGKHDRAWSERPIFGKIRYMNETGIEKRYREFLKFQKV